MDRKKLGLGNVVSISVGLVIATSCLVSLGNGAGTLGVTFILEQHGNGHCKYKSHPKCTGTIAKRYQTTGCNKQSNRNRYYISQA